MFTGNAEHNIDFASANDSRFAVLDITAATIKLAKSNNVYIRGELIGETGEIKGYAILVNNKAKLPDVVNGSIKIIGNYEFDKDLNVKGNLNLESGTVKFNGHTVKADKKIYTYSSYLHLQGGTLNCTEECKFESSNIYSKRNIEL